MAANGAHDVSIRGRKVMEVTGVVSVESFDVNEFMLTTSAGPLNIKGADLHMKHLDLQAGVAIIEGTVASMSYVEQRVRKRHLPNRLFR